MNEKPALSGQSSGNPKPPHERERDERIAERERIKQRIADRGRLREAVRQYEPDLRALAEDD